MDTKQFSQAILQIAEEKGIPKEKVIETVEMAISAAYKKDYGKKGQNIKVEFNPETGEMKFFQVKLVVDESMLREESEEGQEENAKEEITEENKKPEEKAKEIKKDSLRAKAESADKKSDREKEDNEEERRIRFNPEKHIMIEEARKTKKGIKTGEELIVSLDGHSDFGRIAAQTAKQVIIQRIREAEREAVFDEYKSREGEVVSGVVQRVEGRTVFLDIGRATGTLFSRDQIQRESYRLGQRFRVYIQEVSITSKGPLVVLSRSHPKIINKLFEIEVPEVANGIVVINSIAREPGSRSKIAVSSKDENVDPIGSLVGQKGTRVSTVINELAGEKIDIIEWNKDPAKFITNSLSPAKVIRVKIIDEKKKSVLVVVPEDQLSLAIGRGGQNVRLAAKLTGWRIDVRAESSEKSSEDEKSSSKKEKTKKKTTKKKSSSVKATSSKSVETEKEKTKEEEKDKPKKAKEANVKKKKENEAASKENKEKA